MHYRFDDPFGGRLARLLVPILAAALAGSAVREAVGKDPKAPQPEVPEFYRRSRTQAGHEFVKTEQFVVPVATTVSIDGLDFPPGGAELTAAQKRILQQVFNALEEITENTVGDSDAARVAEFAKMEFDVIGHADSSDPAEERTALAEARARTVIALLTNLGTPPWRLHLKAAGGEKPGAGLRGKAAPAKRHVEFVRIK